MDAIKGVAYFCKKCGQGFLNKDYAEKCCSRRVCELCNKELTYNYHYTACNTCREARRVEKAEQITLKDYYEKFPDYPLFTPDGRYIQDDFEEWAIEQDEECIPDYLYGATERFITLSADSIITNLEEQVDFEEDIERFTDEALSEICEFCEKWNQEHKFQYYDENPKIVVIANIGKKGNADEQI